MDRFVETSAEELNIQIHPLGSTIFQRPELSGAEPDECFYIRNIALVRGKKRLDFTVAPGSDLVSEIDISNSSPNRLQVYADLGVAENWIYDGELLTVEQLQNGVYSRS